MSAVEVAPDAPAPGAAGGGAVAASAKVTARWPWWGAVALVVAGALGLRLWGATHGLPYAYNADENAHFLPGAIALFGHAWNPHYFVNPPAYTYVVHAVFAVWFGGRDGVQQAYATDPGAVLLVGRVTAAVLGTVGVWLTYLAGARLAGRPVGLLACAMLAVAFLPVFYAHLALNDAPLLAPVALSLWGTAGILRRGRIADFLVAGAGLGLACATKYTGGIVLLPLVAAAVVAPRRPPAAVVRGLALAGAAAIAAFLVANPYALLDLAAFRDGLTHQADASAADLGKLGLTERSGYRYYAWTLTWGLGWVPTLAAVAGAVMLAVRDRRLFAVLAPSPVVYLLFMGSQERFFGRWVMPILPVLCLLAAVALWRAATWATARRRALLPLAGAVVAVAACAQGAVVAVHIDRVLSRRDTRGITREWMVAHIPPRSKIVVEPGVVPDAWTGEIGRPYPGAPDGRRWVKYPTSRSRVANDGSLLPGPGRIVKLEDYERTLRPELVDRYEAEGYCWVISGSTQRGRAEAQPRAVPGALAYYRELARRSDLVFVASPYRRATDRVRFNFDWSFDYYPLQYERPGPLMRVHRLRGGRCARVS